MHNNQLILSAIQVQIGLEFFFLQKPIQVQLATTEAL